jgi:hypothetical protein
MNFESINGNLVKKLMEEYPKMFKEVLDQELCDIDLTFLGFIDTYYYLSKIIPLHWTVIDFGCAYNAQAYFFQKHKKYIAVDNGVEKIFRFKNTEYFCGTISDYLKQKPITKEVFAICNYVPSNQTKLVRAYYPNCYIFYPSGGMPKFINKEVNNE